jgi:uncharacterized membrane protein
MSYLWYIIFGKTLHIQINDQVVGGIVIRQVKKVELWAPTKVGKLSRVSRLTLIVCCGSILVITGTILDLISKFVLKEIIHRLCCWS